MPGWTLEPDGKIHRTIKFKEHVRHESAEPEFHMNTRALQSALEALDVDDPPRREDKSVSCDAEFWGEWIPDGPLDDWLVYMKTMKVLNTYLELYRQTDVVYPRWNVIGARSGRMSASRPNLQNITKRKSGIRAVFVPSPRRVFVVADYSSQELFTLAESMLSLGIIGNLYKVLTSGQDAHRYIASLVLRKPAEEVTKEERQTTKACSFGCPGGLGAKKLAAYARNYGAKWTTAEAGERRQAFFDAFPDIAEFLRRLKTSQDEALRRATGQGKDEWAERLGTKEWNVIKTMTFSTDPAIQRAGLEAERQLCVELGSGRQRGYCRFTEGANTYFQGPASDVTKAAVWRAYRAGLEIVMVVHDEIVIEVETAGPGGPEAVEEDARKLVWCMKEAFCEICPRMGEYAGVEVKVGLKRWGPATSLDGKELVL